MLIAPKVFTVDDDDLVVLLDGSPSEAMLAKVEQAARSCPKAAIVVKVDDD
jgi:ferredoxin